MLENVCITVSDELARTVQRLEKNACLEIGQEWDALPEFKQQDWINFTAWGVQKPKMVLRCSARNLLPASYIKCAYVRSFGYEEHDLLMLQMYRPIDDDDSEEVVVPEILVYDGNKTCPQGEDQQDACSCSDESVAVMQCLHTDESRAMQQSRQQHPWAMHVDTYWGFLATATACSHIGASFM